MAFSVADSHMSVMEGGKAWLLNCLNSSLDVDPGIRQSAEAALTTASSYPGYGVALANVILDRSLPLGPRQLAAVILKQYVKQHWDEGSKDNTIIVSTEDKIAIRSLLLQALDDSHRKIRTAVGMAIASIASCDWPEDWPNLMEFLLHCINDQNDMNKVNGALKCLALFSGDLDDMHIPQLVPVLFPSLFTIVSSPHAYSPSMRRRAFIIFHSCISTLGVMTGVYQSETKALVSPMLKAWMHQFAAILSLPVPKGNPDDWGLRMEVLKCLMQLVQNFPKLVHAEFSVVLSPLWQTFVSALEVCESACVHGVEDSFSELADSDGNEQSLESFCVQILELLQTLVGQPRYSKIIEHHLNELAYYTIGYMQMTNEQVETWSSDPNEFVSDEENLICSCRVSGILLLEELVTTHEMMALQSIVQSIERRISEAASYRAMGKKDWWKIREVALLTVGTISESVIEAGMPEFNVERFLDNILLEDLNPAVMEHPFLYGRALWVASKFASCIDPKRFGNFLNAAIGGLGSNIPVLIKVSSCRALLELLPLSKTQVSKEHSETVLTALCSFIQEASEESLHLALETLQAAIKADAQTSWMMESQLSPLVLNVWKQYISDPFVSIDTMEVLQALKDTPGCVEPLVSRVLPFVGPVLANPADQPKGLVAGVLDLLTVLLKKSSLEVVQAIYNVTFYPLIGVILHSDDDSELQNGTECLAVFLQEGGECILNWSKDPNSTMKILLDVAAKLLNPELPSSSSLFVERLITQLIQNYPTQMAPHLQNLVAALVQRMETSEILGLTNSLILTFARLVHISAPDVSQFINLLISTPARNCSNALTYVMSEWMEKQGEVQGAYQIKVTAIALALILASKHPELSKIYVRGQLVQPAASGIVTRSRAKTMTEQWTSVPVPVKLLTLLIKVLAEMQEQISANTNEDDDWEEVDDSENEDEGDYSQCATQGGIVSGKTNGKSVFQPLDDMKHLLTEEVEKGDYQDDPCAATDPINKLDIVVYLSEFLKKLAADDNHYFNMLCQGLSEKEKTVLQSVLTR